MIEYCIVHIIINCLCSKELAVTNDYQQTFARDKATFNRFGD